MRQLCPVLLNENLPTLGQSVPDFEPVAGPSQLPRWRKVAGLFFVWNQARNFSCCDHAFLVP
jgi:hypothetical protein